MVKSKNVKKRILVLNYEFPPLGGGGGVASKLLAKGFLKNGYDVDVVTSWFPGLKLFERVDGINVHRVKVRGRKELPTASMISMLDFPLKAYRKASELCKKYKYEFINTHFAVPTGPVGVWLSRKFKTKNILSIHGGDIFDPTKRSSPHNKWYFRKTVRWVLNNSDFVVAQSSNTKENAIKYYHPKKDIKIIPLPYEPFKFRKVSRKVLGLKDDVFYTVSVGRLVKRKGFDFLIRGIAETKDVKVHALIIGDGPELNNLKSLAKSLGVVKRVHFLGQVSDSKKFQYLAVSDVFVLSSVHEGFGIVLLEAMQVGLPIISTDNGGQRDLIEDKVNGFLVSFGNFKTLVNDIRKLKNNKTLKSKILKTNIKKGENYSASRVTKVYLKNEED